MMNEAAIAGDILKEKRIRATALCVIWRSDSIFVAEGTDVVKQQTFYRPLGGSIEFGERGADTVIREFREEVGAELANVRYLCTLENIFTYNGEPGHEIVLVYEGEFADPEMYNKPYVDCTEGEGLPFRAVWKRVGGFSKDLPLYPDGLWEVLTYTSDVIFR